MARLSGWFQAISEAQQAILVIAGMVGIMAIIWATLWDWLTHLQKGQMWLLGIASLCLIIIISTLFISWWYKRAISSMPTLLSQLNRLALNWIENYQIKISENDPSIIDDLGGVLNLNPGQLMAAMRKKDKPLVEKEFTRVSGIYQRMLSPKDKKMETLNNLLLTGEVLNSHGCGLSNLTTTPRYQKLRQRIRSLQEQLPSVETSNQVNEFLNWSEGLYCLLISTKPLIDNNELASLLPAKVKAETKLLHHGVENLTANLITAVRESMDKKTADKKKDK